MRQLEAYKFVQDNVVHMVTVNRPDVYDDERLITGVYEQVCFVIYEKLNEKRFQPSFDFAIIETLISFIFTTDNDRMYDLFEFFLEKRMLRQQPINFPAIRFKNEMRLDIFSMKYYDTEKISKVLILLDKYDLIDVDRLKRTDVLNIHNTPELEFMFQL